MTNWDEIKKEVSKEYSHIKSDICECGGEFKPNGQALCYSEDKKAMVDLINCKCDSCGKEKSFSFPVKSAYGQVMAGFFQKMEELEAKGLSMYSGHTVLEGTPYEDENNTFKKEPFTLKCQCYNCNNIFEFHHTEDNWRCACPKCDAS